MGEEHESTVFQGMDGNGESGRMARGLSERIDSGVYG
jgi:hypothetical protein